MSTTIAIAILMTIVAAATPILLAGLGELIVEKSGVLNLGVEGMMLCGAVTGFATATVTGSLWAGMLAAAAAGFAAAMIFALLTLSLMANQVATGLALTIFGIGVSSLFGAAYVGKTIARLPPIFPDWLAKHPQAQVLFGYDAVVYFSIASVVTAAWFLKSTRPGLILRAVGESDISAHSIGYRVIAIRYAATAYGGAMAGMAGAYYSLSLTPMWADRLTAGRGWIALALVVFAAWRPYRVLAGAYLFGGVMTMELHTKAAGVTFLSPEFLAMLPYLATILVLIVIALRPGGGRLDAPACLGKSFKAG
jgi:simple sugar transport system permease protein